MSGYLGFNQVESGFLGMHHSDLASYEGIFFLQIYYEEMILM